MRDSVRGDRYTMQDMYAQHRGGGLYTVNVSQRIGAIVAALAANRGIHPFVVTIAGGIIAILSTAVGGYGGIQGKWQLGIVSLIGWQIAYCFDCADGQLARATGQTSSHGARLDVLVDFAVHVALVAIIAEIVVTLSGGRPALVGAFGAIWLVNLFTSVLSSGEDKARIVRSNSLFVQAGKVVRDYGAMLLVLGILISFWATAVLYFMYTYLVLNGLILVLSIYKAAKLSVED